MKTSCGEKWLWIMNSIQIMTSNGVLFWTKEIKNVKIRIVLSRKACFGLKDIWCYYISSLLLISWDRIISGFLKAK